MSLPVTRRPSPVHLHSSEGQVSGRNGTACLLLHVAGASQCTRTHIGRKWRTKAARKRDGIKPDISVPEETDASQPSSRVKAPVASGLSRSLEARARQSSGNPPSNAGNPTNPASQTTASTSPTGSTPTGVSSAEMQALTQKALQDVRGLADALRKAEGN